MKANFKMEDDGVAFLSLIAENDVEKVELKNWRRSMISASDSVMSQGIFFREFGGSSDEVGDSRIILKSDNASNKAARLGIDFKLKFIKEKFTYFSMFGKLKKRNEI